MFGLPSSLLVPDVLLEKQQAHFEQSPASNLAAKKEKWSVSRLASPREPNGEN